MKVQCELCPKSCVIAPGQSGECRIRVNVDGKLLAVTYGYPCAVHVDPVEKKPLCHFLPGSKIFSLATVGCNLHCINCQNWEISQENPENPRLFEERRVSHVPPEEVPGLARRLGCASVAYTYTDPVVFYEYTLDTCIRAHEEGLRNALVTAAYINTEPLKELCRYVDAANVDLKAFSDTFYRDVCGATLQPVLNALVTMKAAGVLLEVTNLVIPTLNDKDNQIRDLCRWVVANLGRETPLHFSRFFPRYKLERLPSTPAATLDRAREIARAEGLHHVYVGNILRPDGGNTFCHSCGMLLIERRRYVILANHLEKGRCPKCKTEVYGTWR
jgi:pyruvate formate lyase activating enzyme